MAAHIAYWLVLVITVRIALGVALNAIILAEIVVFVCVTNFQAWWRSPRMRLFRLGGVTTLRRRLDYPCIMCHDSMETGEKVRTLSCDHVFHCGGTVKCKRGIDQWLLNGNAMSWQSCGSCPICCEVPHPVLPWKRPPPALSSTQTSDSEEEEEQQQQQAEEEELLLPSHWFDETLQEGSPSQ